MCKTSLVRGNSKNYISILDHWFLFAMCPTSGQRNGKLEELSIGAYLNPSISGVRDSQYLGYGTHGSMFLKPDRKLNQQDLLIMIELAHHTVWF
jgi:hypothetical protein